MLNESTATAVAEEPQELYDTLKPTEQEVFDLIGSLGFKADRNDDGEWIGLAMQGDDIIGPHKKLSKLAEAVQKHFKNRALADTAAASLDQEFDGDDDAVLLKEDHRGNTFLPGTEPIVDQQIAAAAGHYHALKIERTELLRREFDAKDELITIAHQKSHLFKPDPDNSNSKIYKVGDLVVRIANEWKEKITTEIVKDDN